MKKNHLKKLVILFSLVVILALLIFLLKANETTKLREGAEINGLKLVQNSSYGTVKIVSYDKENKYIKAAEAGKQIDGISDFVIPEEVEIDGKNYYITEIGENAFSNSTAFKTVTIPETVKKIGSGAFTKCTNLEKIVISSPKTLVASDAVDTSSLECNGETSGNLTEFENKIIGTLNSSEGVKFGAVQWKDSIAKINLYTEYEKYTIQYRVNEGEWTEGTTVSNLNLNDKVEARLSYGESVSIGYASYTVEYANDTIKPTVTLAATSKTTSTITVQATASDGQTGLNGEYKWYLGDTLKATTATNTYKFEGLTENKSYVLKVEVTDNCSNTNAASVVEHTDIILSNHTSDSLISFGDLDYDGSGLYIYVNSYALKGTLLYQVNGKADDGWQSFNDDSWGEVYNLSNGDVVYAKIIDGETSTTGYASYTIIDNDPTISSFYYNNYSTDYIEIYYSVEDDVEIKNIEIYCDGYLKYSDYPYSEYSSNYVNINNLSSGTRYEIKIVVTDVSENTTEQTEYWSTESGC